MNGVPTSNHEGENEMTDHRSDVVVIGAGHNGLITAAYLARAGLRVTVLEDRDVLGGGTATEQLTLPGFLHDPAASGHIGLQLNPLLRDDELGLLKNGLRYVMPDPVAIVHTADGEPVTLWSDEDRTAAQLDGFAAGDGDAYRTLLRDWRDIADVHIDRMGGAPGTVPDRSAEAAAKWGAIAGQSAYDLVHERFRDDRSRLLMLWLSSMSTQPIRRPGTGLLPVSVVGMMSGISWPNAVGGSGALVDALVASIQADGGQVLAGRRATRIVVEGGRAVAVETATGERFDADRAVVTSTHAQHLQPLLGEARLPSEFDALDRWRAGASLVVVHLALPRTPTYRLADGPQAAVIAGRGGIEGLGDQADQIAAGHPAGPGRWLMAACSSVADPSRAPEGQATLKLMVSAPYALEGDPGRWEREGAAYADAIVREYAEIADGYEPGDELARVVHTPVDLERWNLNHVEGGQQGGEMTPDQMGPNRPVQGWAGYRMPFDGLYLTGASTHPGGTVAGFSGRNAARLVLEDVGLDPASVMSVGTTVSPA